MKVKSCRFCLAVEVRVLKLGNTDAKQFIEKVFKENGFRQELSGAHYICYECKALLHKSYNFFKRILTAQEILQNLVKKSTKITTSMLNAIDRQETGISSSLTTQILDNIDVFYDDSNDLKEETDYDVELYNSNENLDICDKYETTDDPALNEYKEHDIIIKTKLENSDKFDPTFSIEKYKESLKKKKTNSKNRVSIDAKTENHADNPVKKSYKRQLEPSKFILSLPNVGDRSERRKNKTYTFTENYIETNRDDKEYFQPDSSDESSNSSEYNYYNENGGRMRPIREYPRKCECCEYEVMGGKEHYIHYMHVHPDTPYPYSVDKPKSVCQYCGKLFRSIYYHVQHELTHRNEKNIACSICPAMFWNQARLISHMNTTHTKLYSECDYCGKKFKTKSDLKRHIRIHTGEKPFKCIICGARFTTKGNLGIHYRSKHENLKENKRKTKSSKRERESVYFSDESDDSLIALLGATTKQEKRIKKTT